MNTTRRLLPVLTATLLTMTAATAVAQLAAHPTVGNKRTIEGEAAKDLGRQLGLMIRSEDPVTGQVIELARFIDGQPYYHTTCNVYAADTVGADEVFHANGFNFRGDGVTVGIWDEAHVRATHVELNGRVTNGDAGTVLSDHSTHVAGTVAAVGTNASARGMAQEAAISSYDWGNDIAEMTGATGVTLSNQSYGYTYGWQYDPNTSSWRWYGDPAAAAEDDSFGQYAYTASLLDSLAYSRPTYLGVWAAGNDRNDSGPGDGASHYHGGGTEVFTDTHQPNATAAYPYDCMGVHGSAKNVLTVGAVEDVSGGWAGPSTSYALTSFSSTGPADDLRIKPDIVANGSNLFSCTRQSDASYDTFSGTSMAAPNATGSAALLLDYWREIDPRAVPADPRSATLKGLIIHTARALNDTPSPLYGWGLMDAFAAALALKADYYSRNGADDDDTQRDAIRELTLTDGGEYVTSIKGVQAGDRLRVTLCWTDPAHAEITGLDNPTPALVNDLDLEVTLPAHLYRPWRLETRPAPTHFAANNTYADSNGNTVDNVEVVDFIADESGTMAIRVSHKGTLTNGAQDFTLLIGNVFRLNISVPHQRPTLQSALLSFTEEHNCCETGHGAGCSDPGIQACVCAVDDFCCDVNWHFPCVLEMEILSCGSCDPADSGAIMLKEGAYTVAAGTTISRQVTLFAAQGEVTISD